MSVLLDDPGVNLADDALDRLGLAKTIFDLIRTAPADWTLRIGVYGKWGEGKTTVLNLIEALALEEKFAVAKFNPSLSANPKQLWSEFFLAIHGAVQMPAAATGIKKIRAQLATATRLDRIFQAGQEIPQPIVKTLAKMAALASDTLQQKLSITQQEVAAIVSSAGKRLVVFIDDVDRVEPVLVPKLLLALRELDIPMTSFIAAIDPEVVTEGLAQVHSGWNDAPEFLEKILQFHYWLAPPSHAATMRLARLQLPSTGLQIPPDVLEEIATELPQNPRKLKEFFRSLWQIGPVVNRHRPDDIEWTLVLLLELLRAENPNLVDTLLRSPSFRQSVAASTFFEKTSDTKRQESITQEIDSEIARAAPGSSLSPEKRERLMRIIKQIGDAPLTTAERIEYWASARNNPPSMTLKEADEIWHKWKSDRSSGNLLSLIETHSETLGIPSPVSMRALFGQLTALRQEHLSAASSSQVIDELRDEVADAGSLLDLIAEMVGGVLSNPAFGFGADDIVPFCQHVLSWAHFTNTPEYVEARRSESELFTSLAARAGNFAADLIDRFEPWDKFKGFDRDPAAKEMLERLIARLMPIVIADVEKRFERPEGIASMKTEGRMNVRRYLLLSPDAGLYSAEFMEKLRELVGRARKERVIQKNFITAIESIAYSYTMEFAGAVTPEMRLRLEKAAQFIPLLWDGAVASPVQPRLRGDLAQTWEKLKVRFEPFGAELKLPRWWTETESGAGPSSTGGAG